MGVVVEREVYQRLLNLTADTHHHGTTQGPVVSLDHIEYQESVPKLKLRREDCGDVNMAVVVGF